MIPAPAVESVVESAAVPLADEEQFGIAHLFSVSSTSIGYWVERGGMLITGSLLALMLMSLMFFVGVVGLAVTPLLTLALAPLGN